MQFKTRFLTLLISIVVFLPKSLFGVENTTNQYYEMSIEENIETPAINKKLHSKIVDYQKKHAEVLISHKQKVETMRNGEVLVVSINTDMLFAPNDTILLPTADNYLRPYSTFLKTPNLYKVLIVVHSDNTGSEDYTYKLTESRVNEIYNWFANQNVNTSLLIPYAMGDTEPLKDNNSSANRKANRRLEIYLIPSETMIEMAKRGNLR